MANISLFTGFYQQYEASSSRQTLTFTCVPSAAPGYAGPLLRDRPVSRNAPVTVPWMHW